MTWAPDQQLDLHIQRIVTRAFEDELGREEEERRRLLNRLAAEGTLRSGATILRSEALAVATLARFSGRIIPEVLEALRDIYGAIPLQALDWIRSLLTARFEGYANGRDVRFTEERSRMNMVTAGARDTLDRAVLSAKRDLEIALQPLELRARLSTIARGELPSATQDERTIDAFVSHASEDKSHVARPLADDLKRRGYDVWLDEYELAVGKSVYASIDDGLRRSRFGVVILSPNFFAKRWPQNELHALAALSAAEGANKILPVWHDVDREGVARFSPLLADVYAANMKDGLARVVEQIAIALGTARGRA